MKILFHAINGVGLGHVIRTSRIADALLKLNLNVDVVFATNTKYSSFLKNKYKTYQLNKDTRDVVDGKYSYSEYLHHNTLEIKEILAREKPNAILFDCELNKELLLYCKNESIKTIFVLRNSTPERFSDIRNIMPIFDSIIIPHSSKNVPEDQRNFLKNCSANFTGPIIDTYSPVKNIARRNILISLGSGADIPQNKPLFSAVDSFLRYLNKNQPQIDNQKIQVEIVTGPFFNSNLDLSGFQVHSTTDCLAREMYRAKVVISGAGYNTVNEIISTKTPAILIPLSRKWDNQYQRAEHYEKQGCIKVASEDLWISVSHILNNWKEYHNNFPNIESGNIKAAEIVYGLLSSN